MAASHSPNAESDRLYEQYGKPLEATRWGQFIVVSLSGETIVADSLLEAVQRAIDAFGPGGTVFKIGDKAVGRMR